MDSPLIRRDPRRSPAIRLFCLPYAGAGASVFGTWPDLFPPEIEVATIQLPGREDRQLEAPFTEMEPLVRTLATALRRYAFTPMAFFGHCAGALLAFELAAECRRQYAVTPQHLFVSAQPAPHLPPRNPAIHALPEDQFRAELGRLAGAPPEVLANDALVEMVMPSLRADFELWEGYRYHERKPLSCPITAFGGERDQRCPIADLAGWKEHTTSSFDLHTVDGGHFFVNEAPGEIAQVMAAAMR